MARHVSMSSAQVKKGVVLTGLVAVVSADLRTASTFRQAISTRTSNRRPLLRSNTHVRQDEQEPCIGPNKHPVAVGPRPEPTLGSNRGHGKSAILGSLRREEWFIHNRSSVQALSL